MSLISSTKNSSSMESCIGALPAAVELVCFIFVCLKKWKNKWSGLPDHFKQDGDNGDHQQDVNKSSRCISEKTNCPDNDKYNRDQIEYVTHKKKFKSS